MSRIMIKSRSKLLPEQLEHLHAAVAVTPFVVVPADDLHEFTAVRHRQFAVEDAGVRITYVNSGT